MNVFQSVTQTIVEKLSEGVIPWRKTWAGGLPASYRSRKEYRGINIILLGLQDFTSRYWVTFKEAQRLGGFVSKGSKSAKVIYWHWRTEEERAQLKASGKCEAPAPCFPFISSVFNLEQTEGLEIPEDDIHVERKVKLAAAEEFLSHLKGGPQVTHGLSFAPCYQPLVDVIQMPHLSQFCSAEHYYSTLFHELVHSTGHSSRLNRELASSRNVLAYSYEELVAELGAAFLCAITGIENQRTVADHAAYIDGWKRFLSSDSSAFLRAAGDAQRAVDLLRGGALEHKEKEEEAEAA
jgi:antirestriction protein ArdC